MSIKDNLLSIAEKHKGTDIGGLLQSTAYLLGDYIEALDDLRAENESLRADCVTMHQGLMKIDAISGLNLLPQQTHHDDAAIVGTTKGLTDLRDAISAALKSGESKLQTFASDGEGYTLIIKHLTADNFKDATPHYAE